MQSKLAASLVLLTGSVFLILIFQNCGQGFNPAELTTGDLSSTAPTRRFVSSGPVEILPAGADFKAGSDLEFSVANSGFSGDALYVWGHSLNTYKLCREISSAEASRYHLKCLEAGSLVVTLTVEDRGQIYGPSQVIVPLGIAPPDTTGPTPTPTPAPNNPLVIIFDIASGTANGNWNTEAMKLEAFVGQTVRISNKDDTANQKHGLTTANGKPCGNIADIPFGQSADCVISQAYDSATDGPLYDPNGGMTARFYMVAYDPAQLYQTNCQTCHGALDASVKKGRTASQIQTAIGSVPAMQGLSGLTARQIQAIEFALGK